MKNCLEIESVIWLHNTSKNECFQIYDCQELLPNSTV